MTQTLTTADGKQLVNDADHVALERLVTEAAWRVDEGKSDTLHELFVDNGELDLGNTVCKGREAIKNWGLELEKSQTYKCIRHVAGNMRFVAISDDTAEGVTILTVFMDDEKSSAILCTGSMSHFAPHTSIGEPWKYFDY